MGVLEYRRYRIAKPEKKREILNELLFELDIIVFETTISELQEAASEIIARRYSNEILSISK
jgi:hypothetical protein